MSNAERSHHENGFSKLDKFDACLHFKGKPVGKAAKRGTDIHDRVEAVLRLYRDSLPPNPYHFGDSLEEKAAKRIVDNLDCILSIEEKLSLIGDDFEELAYGYADYIGKDKMGTLTVVDLKTGSQPPESYRLQLTALAVAAMEQYNETKAKCVLVYADSDDEFSFDVELGDEDCESVYLLYSALAKKAERPPRENDFCNWCANREHCPVWVKPVKTLLAIDEAAEIQAAGFSKEAILANPETASRFWSAYKKFTSLVEDWGVDEKLKGWIAEGQSVPSWKTQTRKGRQSVDTEKVLNLILPKIGTAKASKFITIKTTDLIKAWGNFTTEPLPVEIVEGEETTALVAVKGGK